MSVPPTPREERVSRPGTHVARATVPVFRQNILEKQGWIRLSAKRYAGQFFSSKTSRFTPDSWAFPCCYLGCDFLTSTAEMFGDQLAARRNSNRTVLQIASKEAKGLQYLSATKFPALKLCDLTDATTRLRLNFETGSMMTPDLTIPQAWAEVIAVHKNQYDGIVYRSRHTDRRCVALWNRLGGRNLGSELPFNFAGEFYRAFEAYELARSMGMRISFLL